MYSTPSSLNATGPLRMPDPVLYDQSSSPFRSSYATTLPSASPVNTRPPAVASIDADIGDRVVSCHLISPFAGSIAMTLPNALPGRYRNPFGPGGRPFARASTP